MSVQRADSAVTVNSETNEYQSATRKQGSSSNSLQLLAVVSVLLYTINGEILQAATSENVPGARCSPMLMMTLCHSSAVLVLPWFVMFRKREDGSKMVESLLPGGNMASALGLIMILSVFLFLPNYLWTKSISYQPVGTTNAVQQTSVGFAYVGSQLCLHGASGVGEGFTPGKTCGVFLAIFGSLIGLLEPSAAVHHNSPHAGAQSPATSVLGASLALASSAAQAGYMVFSKRVLFAVRESLESIALVWAGVAVVHLVFFLPVVLFLWPMMPPWAGGEKAEFPDVREHPTAFVATAASVVIAGMVNAINTVIGVRGSPVLVSMAYTLALPLTRLADWVLHGIQWTPPQVAGDVLILASIAIMLRGQQQARRAEDSGDAEELQRLQGSAPKESKGA